MTCLPLKLAQILVVTIHSFIQQIKCPLHARHEARPGNSEMSKIDKVPASVTLSAQAWRGRGSADVNQGRTHPRSTPGRDRVELSLAAVYSEMAGEGTESH